ASSIHLDVHARVKQRGIEKVPVKRRLANSVGQVLRHGKYRRARGRRVRAASVAVAVVRCSHHAEETLRRTVESNRGRLVWACWTGSTARGQDAGGKITPTEPRENAKHEPRRVLRANRRTSRTTAARGIGRHSTSADLNSSKRRALSSEIRRPPAVSKHSGLRRGARAETWDRQERRGVSRAVCDRANAMACPAPH